MSTEINVSSVIAEVLDVMKTMRARNEYSEKWIERHGLELAIGVVSHRRGVQPWQVESALDGALAFRRA